MSEQWKQELMVIPKDGQPWFNHTFTGEYQAVLNAEQYVSAQFNGAEVHFIGGPQKIDDCVPRQHVDTGQRRPSIVLGLLGALLGRLGA
jgi:hypothetical protein